ncbi:MAG: galactose oxidase-like domain-containing protein, partial [Bacteroidota bacterium]
MTLTDIFCSYALILPDTDGILIAGGTKWTGTEIDGQGNANSTIFKSGDDTLSLGNDMLRPRWYATATPLMNGEVYVQGGKGGEDLPEVRDTNGVFRTLTGALTGSFSWWYPFNFLGPDGRVFGFDSAGL